MHSSVVPEHRGGQDGWHDDPKKKKKSVKLQCDEKQVSQSGRYDEENKRASKTHS
jgi:hypothetical protein